MIYGYVRVSTRKQVDGYGLEVKKNDILSKYPTAIIFDEQYTGTKLDRPIFKKLIESLKTGDILVVSKLDRFARNTVEGIKVVEKLFPLAYHLKKTSARMIILRVCLEVLLKIVDPVGKDGDLYLGRTGIARMRGEFGNKLLLFFACEHFLHLSFCRISAKRSTASR